MNVTLVQYGPAKGWELGDVRVEVEYDSHAKPRWVDTVIRLGGELSEEQARSEGASRIQAKFQRPSLTPEASVVGRRRPASLGVASLLLLNPRNCAG